MDGGVAQRHATCEPIDGCRPVVEEQLDKFKQAAGERDQQRRLAARVDGAQFRPEPDEPLAEAQVTASHGRMHERVSLPVGAACAPAELDDCLEQRARRTRPAGTVEGRAALIIRLIDVGAALDKPRKHRLAVRG